MNFTLTPGMYAALNQLSKAARRRVLDAAFAYVIEGIRPGNLSKNLLVMFMMLVDSATDGKVIYTPDMVRAEEEKEQPETPSEIKPAEPVVEEDSKCTKVAMPVDTPVKDFKPVSVLANVKVKMRKRRRNKKTAGL